MLFTEGTILKHPSWWRVLDFKSYLPIGSCVTLVNDWWSQGADIIYCTSRKGKQAQTIANLLQRFGFAGSKLFFRENHENYGCIVEQIQPWIIIEDDCRSIGGVPQMCITQVDPQLRKFIISIVVREFEGIDSLPADLSSLNNFASQV